MKRVILFLFFASCLLVEKVTAQQWGGTNDQTSTIYRSGNITVNGVNLGRYGGTLAGDSNPYSISSYDNESHDLVLFGSGGVGTLNLRLYDGSLKLGYNATPATILYNNGNASFGGNVGIGHASPQKSLDVNTGADNFASIGHTIAVGQWSGLHFGYKENNSLYRKSAIVFERLDADANGKIHLLNNGTGSESATLADARLTIDQNGNVGINTASPNETLTVNGTIYGREVKVDLSVPGPDYVFEKQYELPPLEVVQRFISINKRLPDVPSAKEMEANGINVGEMNMLLLKKIEELTLYVIMLQEKSEKQDDLIRKLQNR